MRKYTKLVCVSILAVLLLLELCKLISGTKNSNTVEFISEKKLAGIVREIAGANRQQKNVDSKDETGSEIEHPEETQEYFEAIDNAPIGMTFEELFGDVEYPYNNGKDIEIELEDEVYLQEKELNMEARIGGTVEVHYPQIKKSFLTDAMSEQMNLLIRDTAFSFFDDLDEITYEEAISRIEEEMKTGICDVKITYEVLQCTDEYLSIIFSVSASNGFRVYRSQYLATIDIDTGQYIHFSDIMDMEELTQILQSDYYEVYTGTHAFLKEEDVHEPDM